MTFSLFVCFEGVTRYSAPDVESILEHISVCSSMGTGIVSLRRLSTSTTAGFEGSLHVISDSSILQTGLILDCRRTKKRIAHATSEALNFLNEWLRRQAAARLYAFSDRISFKEFIDGDFKAKVTEEFDDVDAENEEEEEEEEVV